MLILLILSYFLYDDSFLFPSTSSQQIPIGMISSSKKDVRKKNISNMIWLPGNKKDQVYDQDSIFTGEDSEASIQLNDGSVLQLQENSLVNLNTKNGQMQLDLRFGQFAGNGKTLLHFKTTNDEYTLKGKNAQFEISRSPIGTLDVKIISGSAEITSKAGTHKLNSNELLKISKDKEEKIELEAKIHLLTQDDFFHVLNADKKPLSFEWQGQGPLTQYQIEIAKTADFKKIISLQSTTEQRISLREALKEGSYFWRVKGLDGRHKILVTSLHRKFYLSNMLAPKIKLPEDQSTFKTPILPTNEKPQITTQVSWEADSSTKSFQWQLSKTAEFKEIIQEKTLSEKSLITSSLDQGTYFTRVRGFDKEQHSSEWSPVHSFNIEFNSEPKPLAPHLVEKHIRFSIPKLEDRAPSAASAPQIAWSAVDNIKTYHWEIANNSRFVGAQTTETPNTKATWTQYKPGKYYVRVFARSELGQNSLPSETGELEVYGDAPLLGPIPPTLVRETDIHAKAPSKEVLAKWSSLKEAKSYLIEMDKGHDFTNPLQLKAESTEFMLPLSEPGKYFVRVKALNESAQEISEFSNIQEASYIFKQTLKAPPLLEPYNKSTVFLQKDMEPLIWLEWEAVPYSTKYNLEISTTEDFSQVIISKTLSETRFLVKEKIPYGKIFWRVRATCEDESLNSDWASRYFMIYHQRNNGF
ncbi:MAG: FecR domain-containing protein [Pseudobdellovibrionaceae bacterium]